MTRTGVHFPVRAAEARRIAVALVVTVCAVAICPRSANAMQDAARQPAANPGYLGALPRPCTPRERDVLVAATDSVAGVLVGAVLAGTPAEQCGLQEGDVVLSVGNQRPEGYWDLFRIVREYAAGEPVLIIVRRAGKQVMLSARLAPEPEKLWGDIFDAAVRGDAAAQYAVAMNYLHGVSTSRDPAKARFWLEHAAERGIGAAFEPLARLHRDADGTDRDWKRARELYEVAAAEGVADAQYVLGEMLLTGSAGEINFPRACQLCQLAADQGHADACFKLGTLYQAGTVLPRDDAQSFRWYLRAAELGHKIAAGYVGNLLATGTGTPQNYPEAIRWLTHAAQFNVAAAQHDLGAMYSFGRGVARDHASAAMWLSAAAEQGKVESMAALGQLYRDLTPPDHAKAFRWLEKAAASGNALACNELGEMFAAGEGVAKDLPRAADLFRQAAEQGHSVGQFNYGLMLVEGNGVTVDPASAVTWLKASLASMPADITDLRAKALSLLGVIHAGKLKWTNFPIDQNAALEYFRQASEAGHLESQSILGTMYRDRQQYAEAIRWLREAATRGDRAAQNNLGTMYYNGQGVAASREEAIAWWIKAYEQGSPTARDSLRKLGIDAR